MASFTASGWKPEHLREHTHRLIVPGRDVHPHETIFTLKQQRQLLDATLLNPTLSNEANVHSTHIPQPCFRGVRLGFRAVTARRAPMLATADWQLLVGIRPSSETADAAGRQLPFVGHVCGGTDHELDPICTRLEASMGRLGVRNQARRGSPFASSTLSSRETLDLHVLPTLGCMNLRGLTPTHVGTLLANKAADVPGARSVQIIDVTLRAMPSEATRETPLVGLVDQRPRPKCKTEIMDTGDHLVDETGRTAYFVRGQQVIDRRGRVAYLIRHHHLINPDTGAAAFRVREQCVLDLDTGAVVYRVRASRALDLTSIALSDPRPSDPSGRRVLIPVPLRQAVTSGDAPPPREVYEVGLKTAFGFGTDEFSSRTRWDFGE